MQEVSIKDISNNTIAFQALRGASVTPVDDGVLQAGVLFIGTGGDVKVDTVGGSTLTFANVGDGTFLPVKVIRVYDTGTDADDILILW